MANKNKSLPSNAPVSSPSAPADDPPSTPKKVPNRGIRKRVLGEGEGDYLIYELAGPETQLPKGSLLPIPTVPQFVDTAAALKWIRNDSGDLLAGKQVMIFRACEILSLRVQNKPTVVIESKPKVTVNAPAAAERSDG